MNAIISIVAIAILFGVIYYLTRDKSKEPLCDHLVPVVPDNEEYIKIFGSLMSKIKQMEEEDAKLRSQISFLQTRAGIESEQTK